MNPNYREVLKKWRTRRRVSELRAVDIVSEIFDADVIISHGLSVYMAIEIKEQTGRDYITEIELTDMAENFAGYPYKVCKKFGEAISIINNLCYGDTGYNLPLKLYRHSFNDNIADNSLDYLQQMNLAPVISDYLVRFNMKACKLFILNVKAIQAFINSINKAVPLGFIQYYADDSRLIRNSMDCIEVI